MPTETTAAPRPRAAAPMQLRAVNGWRGPGALTIAVAHFLLAGNLVAARHLAPAALLVDLFFVLSGLVLAHVYGEALSHPMSAPAYLLRRFGRIWPLHAAMLGILVAYECGKLALQHFGHASAGSPAFNPTGSDTVGAIWTNLLLVQSLGLHDRETWNFPSWSLSVEFATYAAFALFCMLPRRGRRIAAVVIVLASIAGLAFIAPHHMRSTYDYGILRCFAGFFAGVLLCDVLKARPLPNWPLPTLVEAGALALTLGWMWNGNDTALAYAAPLIFCLFIMAFAPERGLVSKILLTPVMQMGIELSLAIYLVHGVAMMLLLAALRAATHSPLGAGLPVHGVAAAAVFALYIALVLVGSFAVYQLIEKPGRAMFSLYAKRLEKARKDPAVIELTKARDA